MSHALCRYLNSRSELLKYAACLHLLPFAPDAIVVDDLSHFHSYASYQ